MYTLRLCGCCHTDGSHETNSSCPCIVIFPQFLSATAAITAGAAAAATAAAANVAATIILFVGECFCEHGNSVAQHLQLQCHFIGFLLHALANVGGNLVLLFVSGSRCCCNGGNLVPEFVTFGSFGGLIGSFVFIFSVVPPLFCL
jgi:hypothetical protein